jgi:hypothetical protein
MVDSSGRPARAAVGCCPMLALTYILGFHDQLKRLQISITLVENGIQRATGQRMTVSAHIHGFRLVDVTVTAWLH